MDSGPTITNADDAKLIELLRSAQRRVVLLTPGVSGVVADEVADAWRRLGPGAVDVIVDADPEVCRLGYGTIGALQTLRAVASEVGGLVCHQPGVRIGLLVSDATTLVFSPTPLLIEAGSNLETRPNAIQLGGVPQDLAQDLGLGENAGRDRVLGLDPLESERVDEVAKELVGAPPVKFDLARRVRVFTSRFQFVELEMKGCFISRKRVRIPSSLVGLAQKPDVESKFHAHFNLVTKGKLEVQRKRTGETIDEAGLQARRRKIEEDYLIQLRGYGSVVLRANKDRLVRDVRRLEAAVSFYANGVKAALKKEMQKNVDELVDALFPAVQRNPPSKYTKSVGPSMSDDVLRAQLRRDIEKAFGAPEGLVKHMQVKLVFKDVAYESLIDAKFLEVARAAMPDADGLHEEYDAVKGV